MKKSMFIFFMVFILLFTFSGMTLANGSGGGITPTIDPFGIFDDSKTTDKKVEDWFKTVMGKLSGYALMAAFAGVIILALLMALPLGQRTTEWLKGYGFKIIGSVAIIGAGLFVVKWVYGMFTI